MGKKNSNIFVLKKYLSRPMILTSKACAGAFLGTEMVL